MISFRTKSLRKSQNVVHFLKLWMNTIVLEKLAYKLQSKGSSLRKWAKISFFEAKNHKFYSTFLAFLFVRNEIQLFKREKYFNLKELLILVMKVFLHSVQKTL